MRLAAARTRGTKWDESREEPAGAMRQVLVDRACRPGQEKRGAGAQPVKFENWLIESTRSDEQLREVHDARDLPSTEDAAKAEVVKPRFFAGLNHAEVAAPLAMSEIAARRRWHGAKIRLFQLINGG